MKYLRRLSCIVILGSLLVGGDIGKHFPDADPLHKGISSIKLLKHVKGLLDKEGTIIHNIDATIIAQKPKMAPHNKGISSIKLLKHVRGLLDKEKVIIHNIDATIIAQKPKMAPHIMTMRENIAAALQINLDQINVKATTEEGLGFTGIEQGISSQAIVLLDK